MERQLLPGHDCRALCGKVALPFFPRTSTLLGGGGWRFMDFSIGPVTLAPGARVAPCSSAAPLAPYPKASRGESRSSHTASHTPFHASSHASPSSTGEGASRCTVGRLSAVASVDPGTASSEQGGGVASVVAVVGAGEKSPFLETPWVDVMEHMAKRVAWIEPGVILQVFPDTQVEADAQGLEGAIAGADIVIGVALQSPRALGFIKTVSARKETVICFDSDPSLEKAAVLGGVRVDSLPLPLLLLAKAGLWEKGSVALKTAELVRTSWGREKADDVWFCVLALVNALVGSVKELQNLRAAGLDSLRCMVGNCATEIRDCLADPQCRAAISCLNQCGPTDQVCSYRCIVSYESAQLEAFSLCVLQKHGCLGLSADIRTQPVVLPMARFRGALLTHELAEGIFVGWLGAQDGALQSSWRVVAGQNAAYDQFPCQFQLFYKGKARGTFWYDPVFKVKKYDGTVVWRRRHYRVRRAAEPGTFTFSVLDNGVISEEFWRIVDAPDDLSWGLFYYSGAAKAAGQAYTGAVLVSPDGSWPAEEQQGRLEEALEKCGIKRWELYSVDNLQCQDPPLGLPEDAPEQPSLLTRA